MVKLRSIVIVPGNQLFPPEHLLEHIAEPGEAVVFMAEDHAACTYVQHHKHKLTLILAAMREHARVLRAAGFRVHYERLERREPGQSYEDAAAAVCANEGAGELVYFEPPDRSFERRLARLARRLELPARVLPTPMFMTPRAAFADWRTGRKQPRMADFYRWQRRRLGILLGPDDGPMGGRWSFDTENRKALPRNLPVPDLPQEPRRKELREVCALVEQHFPEHPGDTANFALPTTRKQALRWLQDFLEQRFTCFGTYEDALTTRSDTLFHSVLSPLLNIGLLTPAEVIDAALDFAATENIALNNVEGFVRQLIGWREFMFGIYRTDGERLRSGNFWRHRRRLTGDWYRGTTGLLPLDHVIRKAERIGWAHHIERLMIAGNLMLLAEVHPREAYRWFMEMFVDAADWVMVPNVYGMTLFADGGSIVTKPYICGANYVRRMSDFPDGDWALALDGLFWRFVARHREFLESLPRLTMLCRHLDRQPAERQRQLQEAATRFLNHCTRPQSAAA